MRRCEGGCEDAVGECNCDRLLRGTYKQTWRDGAKKVYVKGDTRNNVVSERILSCEVVKL